jgi:hypothetical protein
MDQRQSVAAAIALQLYDDEADPACVERLT